ncbi:MAG: DegV family protein [Bacteroidales bacterium]|nr:DegV family protein [Clostridium sp.]MCM1204173.1 DegV family protein [Bacteroidales bacterium]
MKFKIVGDSCTDFVPEDLKKEYVVSVPLTIDVGGYEVVDDESFDQADFLRRVEACPECPKSACPSPESYMESFRDAEQIYVVTLSAKLSGSYNSAELAKRMYQEEHPEVKIHVFDSKSASCGQLLLAYLIERYALEGADFEEIVKRVTAFRDGMQTAFVLESLETLRKNGRLTGVRALVASALNIKPYMKAEDGAIAQEGQARGIKKALAKMVDYIGEVGDNFPEKTVIIAHCNCKERAREVENALMARYHFKSSRIIDTKGISSLYANDGGVIVAF